jgi:hypothetical protein
VYLRAFYRIVNAFVAKLFSYQARKISAVSACSAVKKSLTGAEILDKFIKVIYIKVMKIKLMEITL